MLNDDVQGGGSKIRDGQNSQTGRPDAQALEQAVCKLLPASANFFQNRQADIKHHVANHLDDAVRELASNATPGSELYVHKSDQDQDKVPRLDAGKKVEEASSSQPYSRHEETRGRLQLTVEDDRAER